jgi:lipoate---protein ligase
MQLLDYTCATPEENVALEEALLLAAEAGDCGEVLRFWESRKHFVVLGAGGAVAKETHSELCRAENIPILRRCSGGGTVLQGAGCLNYTLVLDREARPELATIESTNRAILSSVVQALSSCGVNAQIDGISDITASGAKLSGNAQRRRKRWILFHGTILHHFDLALISRYLREPEKQPDYRAHRPHAAFVQNVSVEPGEFKLALARSWTAKDLIKSDPPPTLRDQMQELVRHKYSQQSWNMAF